MSGVLHLDKEAKRELKVNCNNEILPFCSEPKYLGVLLDWSLTYRRHLEQLRKKLTSRVALLRRLAGSGCGAGTTTLWRANLVLVHSAAEYCAPVWCGSAHNRLIDPTINDAWRIAVTGACVLHQWTTFQSSQASNLLRSLHWSHAVSGTPCYGAWTSSPLRVHPPIECKRTAPKIEKPIGTHRTTSHQFICQQQRTCGAVGGLPMECGVDRQLHKTPHFNHRHRHPRLRNDPLKKSLVPA